MRIFFLLCAALLAVPVWAQQTPERFNEVNLQAEVSRDVQNDLLRATLYAEASEADPAELAEKLNTAANEALKIAAAFKTVKTTSGTHQSYPSYDKSKIVGWRGRAQIHIESKDFPNAAKLIAKLQGANLLLGGIRFGVSTELRRQAEQELLGQAVAAFRERAQILTQALGGKSYKIRQLSVQTAGGYAPMPMAMGAAMEDRKAAPTPQLEGGTTQIQVSTNGSIQVD